MAASKKPSDEDLAFIKTRMKLVWVDGQPRFEAIGRAGKGRMRDGTILGTIISGGRAAHHVKYRQLRLTLSNGAARTFKEHVLVWYFEKGEWPMSEIDHRDTNGLNNHPTNLRLATHDQNMANRGVFINNTSGYPGVSFRPDCLARPWFARVRSTVNGVRQEFREWFSTAETAVAWRTTKVRELHGEFATI